MKTTLSVRLMVLAASSLILWKSRETVSALWSWFSNQEAVFATLDQAGGWGPCILFVLFVLQVFLAFIPGQALMIACGYLYGFWGGFFLSWLSLAAGGELAFVLARRSGRRFAEQWISPELLARWDRAAQGQGIRFFTVSLVMPLMPNDAMCYVAGLGRIAHRRFFIANVLGRGIACVFTSAVGAFGADIPVQVWAALLALAAAGSLAWLVRSRARSHALYG